MTYIKCTNVSILCGGGGGGGGGTLFKMCNTILILICNLIVRESTMARCNTCGKDFSRNDALTRHKIYSCSLSPTVQVKQNVAKCEESNSKPVDKMSQDIPTFDGVEFSGEKPKSEKTLVKIMDMLKIPNENRAEILKEEKNLDGLKVPSKEPPAKKMKIIPLLPKSDHLNNHLTRKEKEKWKRKRSHNCYDATQL